MLLQNIPSPTAWGRHRSPWSSNDSSLTFRKGAVVSTNGKSLSTEGFTILCDECLVFPLKGQGWLKWHRRLTGTPSPVPPTVLLLFLFLNNFTKTLHVRGSSTIKKKLIFPQRMAEWPIIKIIATNYCQCLLLTKFIQDMDSKYDILHAIPQWKSTTPAWWQFSPTHGDPDKRIELTHLSSPACWCLSAIRTHLTMKLPAEITSPYFMKYWHRQYFKIHFMAWS